MVAGVPAVAVEREVELTRERKPNDGELSMDVGNIVNMSAADDIGDLYSHT